MHLRPADGGDKNVLMQGRGLGALTVTVLPVANSNEAPAWLVSEQNPVPGLEHHETSRSQTYVVPNHSSKHLQYLLPSPSKTEILMRKGSLLAFVYFSAA